MKKTHLALGLLWLVFLIACKKPVQDAQSANVQTMGMGIPFKKNPYSIENIKAALKALGREDEKLEEDRKYIYFKFDVTRVSSDFMALMAADSNAQVMDIPFASGVLYQDDTKPDRATIESYKDGSLYVVCKSNSVLANRLSSNDGVTADFLDELYLPMVEDEDLQLQALISSGFVKETSLQALRIRICLFKVPQGRVTYLDQFQNTTRPVPHMMVWALVFGVPINTYTNENGNYIIPYAFSAGTYMGTHAKNWRTNIRPFNTTGTIAGAVINVLNDFATGSLYNHGWITSCEMKNPVNIHFGNHNPPRFWAQLLHGTYMNDIYCNQDNITKPPFIVTYAHWSLHTGAASTPMLNHLSAVGYGQVINQYITNLINGSFTSNFIATATGQALNNLCLGVKPDITIKVDNDMNVYTNYSEDLMQTLFHELGHASLYTRLGNDKWGKIIARTIAENGYGNQNGQDWGLIQLNESWAEFMGKEHHRRLHPAGTAFVWSVGNRQPYPDALENDRWFFANWINTGIYYDLMDIGNNEGNDVLGGFTINNMFFTFGATTRDLCTWRTRFVQNNPGINQLALMFLMNAQNGWNTNCQN